MSRIGKKIIRGLREFNNSLKRGDDVTKKFTWRHVRAPRLSRHASDNNC